MGDLTDGFSCPLFFFTLNSKFSEEKATWFHSCSHLKERKKEKERRREKTGNAVNWKERKGEREREMKKKESEIKSSNKMAFGHSSKGHLMKKQAAVYKWNKWMSMSSSLSGLAWLCEMEKLHLLFLFLSSSDRSLIEKKKRSSVMSLSHDDCIHFSLSFHGHIFTCVSRVGSFELIFRLLCLYMPWMLFTLISLYTNTYK